MSNAPSSAAESRTDALLRHLTSPDNHFTVLGTGENPQRYRLHDLLRRYEYRVITRDFGVVTQDDLNEVLRSASVDDLEAIYRHCKDAHEDVNQDLSNSIADSAISNRMVNRIGDIYLERVYGALPDTLPITDTDLRKVADQSARMANDYLFPTSDTLTALVKDRIQNNPRNVSCYTAATLVRYADESKALNRADIAAQTVPIGAERQRYAKYIAERNQETGRDDLSIACAYAELWRSCTLSAKKALEVGFLEGKNIHTPLLPAAFLFTSKPDPSMPPPPPVPDASAIPAPQLLSRDAYMTAVIGGDFAKGVGFSSELYGGPDLPHMVKYTNRNGDDGAQPPECVASNPSMTSIVRGMAADGVKTVFENPLVIWAYADGDTIYMPRAEKFADEGAYCCTLMHEYGHTTGRPDREDRPTLSFYKPGEKSAQQEELIADLTVAHLASRYANIPENYGGMLLHSIQEGRANELHTSPDGKQELAELNAYAERAADCIHGAVNRHIASVSTAVRIESPLRDARESVLTTNQAMTKLQGHIDFLRMDKRFPVDVPQNHTDRDARTQQVLEVLADRVQKMGAQLEKTYALIADLPEAERLPTLRSLRNRIMDVHGKLGTLPSPKGSGTIADGMISCLSANNAAMNTTYEALPKTPTATPEMPAITRKGYTR